MNSEYAKLKSIEKRNLTKAANTLIGICSGLAADGTIVDAEISFLSTWLEENYQLKESWPGDILNDALKKAGSTQPINEANRKLLFETIRYIVGHSFQDTGETTASSPAVPYDDIDNLEISGNTFCLTGEFDFGTRSECEALISSNGGQPLGSITKKTDFLVVGSRCNPDWANSTYGRKIETAIEKRNKTNRPLIISEEVWAMAIRNSKI